MPTVVVTRSSFVKQNIVPANKRSDESGEAKTKWRKGLFTVHTDLCGASKGTFVCSN